MTRPSPRCWPRKLRSIRRKRPGESARAQLRLAQIDLDNSVIRAPVDGQLSEVSVRNGAYVTVGTQLMFLVPSNFWVIANFKERQTHNMRGANGRPLPSMP